jgi:accessory gene regulator B
MLAVVSLILGAFLPTMVLMVSFSLLRLVTGGYHMDTFGKCAIVSITIFAAGGVLSRYTYQYTSIIPVIMLILLCFIIELFCIIKYSPRDNPNRPITNAKEINKFRKMAVFNLILLVIINVILIIYNEYMYSLSVSLGISIAAFIISPIGYKFFDLINGRKM